MLGRVTVAIVQMMVLVWLPFLCLGGDNIEEYQAGLRAIQEQVKSVKSVRAASFNALSTSAATDSYSATGDLNRMVGEGSLVFNFNIGKKYSRIKSATLVIDSYDVDYPCATENDQVYFNSGHLGRLYGGNNIYSSSNNVYPIPSDWIKIGNNTLIIYVDVDDGGWVTQVREATLTIRGAGPDEAVITDIESPYFSGERGYGGRNALFLSGVNANVPVKVKCDAGETTVVGYSVNGMFCALGNKSGKFEIDMGEINVGQYEPGGWLEVKLCTDDGKWSEPFVANFHVAKSPAPLAWQIRERAGDYIIYSTPSFDFFKFFKGIGEVDSCWYFDEEHLKNIQWLVDGSPRFDWSFKFEVEYTMDSSTGICTFGGVGAVGYGGEGHLNFVKKLKSRIFRFGAFDVNGGLTGSISSKWQDGANRWKECGGDLGVQGSGMLEVKAGLPPAVPIVAAGGAFTCDVSAKCIVSVKSDGTWASELNYGGDPLLGASFFVCAEISDFIGIRGGEQINGYFVGQLLPEQSLKKLGYEAYPYWSWKCLGFSNEYKYKDGWLSETKWLIGGPSKVKAKSSLSMMAMAPSFESFDTQVRKKTEFTALDRKYIEGMVSLESSGNSALPRKQLAKLMSTGSASALVSSVETTLMTSGYPSPSVSVASSSTGDSVAFIRDNTSRSAVDRTELVVQTCNDNKWDASVPVWDDGTADFSPHMVALPDGTLVVVWQNLKKSYGDEVNVDKMVADAEIAVGIRNPQSGMWTCRNLTDNACLDHSPKVAVDESGNLTVAWVRNENNEIIGTAEHPDKLFFACFKNGEWGLEKVLPTEGCAILGVDLAADTQGAVLAYVADMDGSLEAGTDQEFFAVRITETRFDAIRLTNDSATDTKGKVRLDGDGNPFFVWSADSKIVCKHGWMGEVVPVFTNEVKVVTDFALSQIARDGKICMAFSGSGAEGSYTDPHLIVYDPASKQWGEGVRAIENPAYEGGYAPTWDSNGNVFMAYAQYHIEEGAKGFKEVKSADVRTIRYPVVSDPSIDVTDIMFLTNALVVGESVRIEAVIRNKGVLPARGVQIKVNERIGGAEYSGTLPEIPGGGECVYGFDWVVSSSVIEGLLDFEFTLVPGESCVDGDVGNNHARWRGPEADVGISGAFTRDQVTNSKLLCARVRNWGLQKSMEGMRLSFVRNDTHETLWTGTVPALNSGRENEQEVQYLWDISGLTFASNIVEMAANLLDRAGRIVQVYPFTLEVVAEEKEVPELPVSVVRVSFVGDVPECVEHEVGKPFGTLPVPVSKDGLPFLGWYSSDGDVVNSDTIVSQKHAQLFARWDYSQMPEWRVKNEGGLYMVVDLSGGPAATSYPVSYLDAVPAGGWPEEYKTTKLVLRRMPAGQGRWQYTPYQLTKDFYIGVFELTQKQWSLVMGSQKSSSISAEYGVGDSCPMYNLSYGDLRGNNVRMKWPVSTQVPADSFLGKLRTKTGLGQFDLPTVDQWHYSFNSNLVSNSYTEEEFAQLAWYQGNSEGKLHSVGMKHENENGLYDMYGNVSEWGLNWVFEANDDAGVDNVGGRWDFSPLTSTTSHRWLYPLGFDFTFSDFPYYRQGVTTDGNAWFGTGARLCLTTGGHVIYDAPIIEPAGGGKAFPIEVTIKNPNHSGTAIYYTLDGSEPSVTNGMLYCGAFHLHSPATVKAIVWCSSDVMGSRDSLVTSQQYYDSVQDILGVDFGVWTNDAEAPWMPDGLGGIYCMGITNRQSSTLNLQFSGRGVLEFTVDLYGDGNQDVANRVYLSTDAAMDAMDSYVTSGEALLLQGYPILCTHTNCTVRLSTLSSEAEEHHAAIRFSGWEYGASYFDRVHVSAVKWTPLEYDIALDAGDGAIGSATVKAVRGRKMPSVAAPARTGFTFAGYFDDPTGGVQYYSSSMASTRDWDRDAGATLYARWLPNAYTLTLDANNESGVSADINVVYGDSLPTAKVPKRNGYVFVGYFDTSATSGGVRYYDAEMRNIVTWDRANDCTLYARWKAVTYEVTYELNGGDASGDMPETARYDTAFAVAPPSRMGYVFTGWSVISGFDPSVSRWGMVGTETNLVGVESRCYCGTGVAVSFLNLTAIENGAVRLCANWREGPITDFTPRTEIVGGYKWKYRIVADEAEIFSETWYKTDVEPVPSGNVVVPSALGGYPVGSIGWCALSGCKDMTGISIPDTVKSIGFYAFYGCASLEGIDLPDALESIGAGAFVDCLSLDKIVIPKYMRDIDYRTEWSASGVFSGCSSLTAFEVATGNANFSAVDGMLCNKDRTVLIACPETMSDVAIPATVTNIAICAFYNCSDLTELTLPDDLSYVGRYAFSNTSITNITIPGSLKCIAGDSFVGRFEQVVVSEGVEEIEGDAFWDCVWLKSIQLPNSLRNISGAAFDLCCSLGSLVIPAGVTNLADHALSGSGLTNVVFEGDAPAVGDIYGKDSYSHDANSNLVAYVRKDSVGWNGPDAGLPAEWPTGIGCVSRPIRYLNDFGFKTDAMSVAEGDVIEVVVFGGNADGAASLQVYLSYQTATAADLDLKAGTVDGVTPQGGVKFPLMLSWASGEVTTRVLRIPVKTDKAIEDEETLVFQLANAQGMEVGETTACKVTIRDANVADDYAAKQAKETVKTKKGVETNVLAVVCCSGDGSGDVGGYTTGQGQYSKGSKVSLKATARPGWEFKGWGVVSEGVTNTVSDKASWSVTLTNDAEIVALFGRMPYVAGLASPADGGKVSGSGYCAAGKKVTLKATANKNFAFVGWYANDVFVSSLASLVLDRSAKPAKSDARQFVITDVPESVTYYAMFKSDPTVFVYLASDDNVIVPGKVTGAGKYAAGKKVTLKTTANKGYVFRGWYEGASVDLLNDIPLTKSATYTLDEMPTNDVEYTAGFITAATDKASIRATVNGVALYDTSGETPLPLLLETNVWTGVYLEWPVAASALSETTVKVVGLPSGLKFAAKDVTQKIGSGKAAQTIVVVPANTIYGAPSVASKVGKNGKATPSAIKLTVTTAGKSAQTYQIDTTVDPLPAWAQGTFSGPSYGDDDTNGLVTVAVASSGKITAKQPVNGKSTSFAASYFDSYVAEEPAFYATLTAKIGTQIITNEMAVSPTVIDVSDTMVVTNGVIEADRFDAWQYNWKVEPWKTLIKPLDKTTSVYYIDDTSTMIDDYDESAPPTLGVNGMVGRVTLKFSVAGTVTTTGEFVTGIDVRGRQILFSISGASTIVPCGNRCIAFVYFAPNLAKSFKGHVRCVALEKQ